MEQQGGRWHPQAHCQTVLQRDTELNSRGQHSKSVGSVSTETSGQAAVPTHL